MTKENRIKVLETIMITRINNKKQKGIIFKSFHYKDGVFFGSNNLELCMNFSIQYIKDIFNGFKEDEFKLRQKFEELKVKKRLK